MLSIALRHIVLHLALFIPSHLPKCVVAADHEALTFVMPLGFSFSLSCLHKQTRIVQL